MACALVYHPDIQKEDVPKINRDLRDRISRAIESRLTTAPGRYGEPLRGTLKGYWKLRVGDYRGVFRVVKDEVWIFGVIHWRDVYDSILRRLSYRGGDL